MSVFETHVGFFCGCFSKDDKAGHERDEASPAWRPLFLSQLGLIKLSWHSGTFNSCSFPASGPGQDTAFRHTVSLGLLEEKKRERKIINFSTSEGEAERRRESKRTGSWALGWSKLCKYFHAASTAAEAGKVPPPRMILCRLSLNLWVSCTQAQRRGGGNVQTRGKKLEATVARSSGDVG